VGVGERCCTQPAQGRLESRAKEDARLDFEVFAGWVSPSSRGLWGGDALLLSTGAAGNRVPGFGVVKKCRIQIQTVTGLFTSTRRAPELSSGRLVRASHNTRRLGYTRGFDPVEKERGGQLLARVRTVQANCRTHRPQKLKCLISLCTNPVSVLSVPIQTVR
jgi:hypothetical protein